jgi:hypothetical protein
VKKKAIGRNRDVQNILVVLGSAVICAGLLAVFFLYYFGPSGRYTAGKTILDPAIIADINYPEKNPRTGQRVHFIFDHMEFSYYHARKGVVRQKDISTESYQKFYDLVSSEKSLNEVTNQIKDLFVHSHPTILTTNMKTLEGADTTTKIFQVIQFVPEDYFRVQLHENQVQQEWAYFYRPRVYQEVMQLFAQTGL